MPLRLPRYFWNSILGGISITAFAAGSFCIAFGLDPLDQVMFFAGVGLYVVCVLIGVLSLRQR